MILAALQMEVGFGPSVGPPILLSKSFGDQSKSCNYSPHLEACVEKPCHLSWSFLGHSACCISKQGGCTDPAFMSWHQSSAPPLPFSGSRTRLNKTCLPLCCHASETESRTRSPLLFVEEGIRRGELSNDC